MNETIWVRIDRAGLEELRALGGSVTKALEVGAKRVMLGIVQDIQGSIRDGSGGGLHNRTGALKRSWTVRSWGSDGDESHAETKSSHTETSTETSIGSTLVYSAIHEFGGTVKATTSKYLAIPIGAALTRAGVAKVASPRQVPDLVFIKTRAQKRLLVKILGKTEAGRQRTRSYGAPGEKKKTTIEPWFVLVEQVKIPARRYVSNAVEKAESYAGDVIDAAVQEEIDKRSGDASSG